MPRRCHSRGPRHWVKASMVAVCSILGVATPLRAQAPATVVIRALDYAFQAPDTIAAGLTKFVLQNGGTVRHEAVLARLKPGHTLAEIIAAKTPVERRDLEDGLVGLILAEPGERSMGSLLVDLTAGRTYILICNLRDAPDKLPHLAQGMAAVIHIR